jgi:hypothetical protein
MNSGELRTALADRETVDPANRQSEVEKSLAPPAQIEVLSTGL